VNRGGQVIFNILLRYCIFESNEVKYIIMGMKVLHNPVHLHYLDEGNACVNWVEYYIVNVSIGYCMDEIDEINSYN